MKVKCPACRTEFSAPWWPSRARAWIGEKLPLDRVYFWLSILCVVQGIGAMILPKVVGWISPVASFILAAVLQCVVVVSRLEKRFKRGESNVVRFEEPTPEPSRDEVPARIE